MRALSVQAWSTGVNRATYALAVIAGASLVFMMALISFGVFMRYVVGQPVLGINEILQLNALALAMLALPYTTAEVAHVRADIFDPALGRWGRWAADIFTRVLSIVGLWVLVGRAWAKALDAYEFQDQTNMLGLPIWPFYGTIAAGMALCILIFAIQILVVLTTRKALHD